MNDCFIVRFVPDLSGCSCALSVKPLFAVYVVRTKDCAFVDVFRSRAGALSFVKKQEWRLIDPKSIICDNGYIYS